MIIKSHEIPFYINVNPHWELTDWIPSLHGVDNADIIIFTALADGPEILKVLY